MLLGLAGERRSGKSTVASLFAEISGAAKHVGREYHETMMPVANRWLESWPAEPLGGLLPATLIHHAKLLMPPLAEAYNSLTLHSVTVERLLPFDWVARHSKLLVYMAQDEGERVITPANKERHVLLMQWVAGVGRNIVHPDIWANQMDDYLRRDESQNPDLVTVSGLRYDNDADPIRQRQGWVIKVLRPDELKPPDEDRVRQDITETAVATLKPDIELINDGNYEQLRQLVAQLYNDLMHTPLEHQPPQPWEYRLGEPAPS